MYDNWRGLSMLSVVGKVLAHIISSKLYSKVEGKLSECQAGFRKGRGCADQIVTLRRVMETARVGSDCHSRCVLLILKQHMTR
mgnify:CR=1 FL=1